MSRIKNKSEAITLKTPNKILGGMYMKYRLLVNVGRSWKHGRVVYNSYIEAQIRQEELRLVGIKSRITDELGGEL